MPVGRLTVRLNVPDLPDAADFTDVSDVKSQTSVRAVDCNCRVLTVGLPVLPEVIAGLLPADWFCSRPD